MSGYGRIVLTGALLAGGLGIAGLRAQTVLGDPRDAAKTFASNCSACHKSRKGLRKAVKSQASCASIIPPGRR